MVQPNRENSTSFRIPTIPGSSRWTNITTMAVADQLGTIFTSRKETPRLTNSGLANWVRVSTLRDGSTLIQKPRPEAGCKAQARGVCRPLSKAPSDRKWLLNSLHQPYWLNISQKSFPITPLTNLPSRRSGPSTDCQLSSLGSVANLISGCPSTVETRLKVAPGRPVPSKNPQFRR